MRKIIHCGYVDCWHNNNIEQTCLAESVTVSATGMCENLTHCDDFECGDCDRFEICTKRKKEDYLRDN